MIGIKIKNGAAFVKHEGVTVRILQSGECGISSVMFEVLEWDLRTEPPHTWEYISEFEIKAMDVDLYEKIINTVKKHKLLLNNDKSRD